jgi:hypothetical protein
MNTTTDLIPPTTSPSNHNLLTLCLALESTIYRPLDNYRNETEMKYQRLREKQLSEE